MIPSLPFPAIPTQNSFATSQPLIQPQFAAARHFNLSKVLRHRTPQFVRRGHNTGERIFYDYVTGSERYASALEADTVSFIDNSSRRQVRRRLSMDRLLNRLPVDRAAPVDTSFQDQFANMNLGTEEGRRDSFSPERERSESPFHQNPGTSRSRRRNNSSRRRSISPDFYQTSQEAPNPEPERTGRHRSHKRQHARSASLPTGRPGLHNWFRERFTEPRERVYRLFEPRPLRLRPTDRILGTEGNNLNRIYRSAITGKVSYGPQIREELEAFSRRAFRTKQAYRGATPPPSHGIQYFSRPYPRQVKYGTEDYYLRYPAFAMKASLSNDHLLFLDEDAVVTTQVHLDPLYR